MEAECHIGEPEKMVYPTEQLRAHSVCVKQESQGIRKRKRIRGKAAGRGEVGEIKLRRSPRLIKIDKISELPCSVLLHIMNFMDTKDAVRTCVLSKRWEGLCKQLTKLKFKSHSRFWRKNFMNFASWILSSRDHSCSLLNLNLAITNGLHKKEVDGSAMINSLIRYVISHNVQNLNMKTVSITYAHESLSLIFGCKSLTSLKIRTRGSYSPTLPKSLHLPALKTLHLQCAKFSASDNDCADPFSNCYLLTTLVLKYCSFPARVFKISNSTLSNLKMTHSYRIHGIEIVLSTPNLDSCKFVNFVSCQLSSTCNLSLLEEVNIFDICGHWEASIFIRWLQILANVKMLTLNLDILQRILPELSKPSPTRLKPPCLVRLESVKLLRLPYSETIYREDVTRVMEYLFDNFPMEGYRVIPSDYKNIFD